MIRFSKLALQAFRSFNRDTVFVFPKKADGFYLVTGENRINSRLSPNGVGKSSLWDGLLWILYGKTTRGLKAGTIANRTGDLVTSGVVEFFVDDRFYAVTRTWNPNSLSLVEEDNPPRVVQQDELDSILGLNYEEACRVLVFGQFSSVFFDLSPTEKLAALSAVLNLDQWTEKSDRARENAKELADVIAVEQRKRAACEGRLQASERALADVRTRAAQAQVERAAEIKALKRSRADVEEKLSSTRAELLDAEKTLTEQEKTTQARNTRFIELDDLRAAARGNLGRAQGAEAAAERALTTVVQKRRDVAKLKGDCPVCYAELTPDHVGAALARVGAEVDAATAELGRASDAVRAGQDAFDGIEAKIREASAELGLVERALKATTARRNSLASRAGAAEQELKTLEAQLKSLERAVNPYDEQSVVLARDVETLRGDLGALDEGIERLGNLRALVEAWGTLFRDLRLWIVERALDELELHVNNAIVELGLAGYSIRFDVERPKADGSGVIRGFQVMIREPGSDEPIPWEAWSGGETQRLRIASAIGLADLICARRGVSSSIEVWDEPTHHLNAEGINDLLALLGTRARTRAKQLYLVDHRTLNAGDFDDEILVVKDRQGSFIGTPQHTTTTWVEHEAS